MASAADYTKYAEECIDMAERADPRSRERLVQMAEIWLKLAQEALEQMSGAQTSPSTDRVQ